MTAKEYGGEFAQVSETPIHWNEKEVPKGDPPIRSLSLLHPLALAGSQHSISITSVSCTSDIDMNHDSLFRCLRTLFPRAQDLLSKHTTVLSVLKASPFNQ